MTNTEQDRMKNTFVKFYQVTLSRCVVYLFIFYIKSICKLKPLPAKRSTA